MLKNYFAPIGNDITKEYLPCSLSPNDVDYHLDYMVAENSDSKKYVAWPGRGARPASGIGTTLFATNASDMSVVRSNGQFSYAGGTGATPWDTTYANQLILGLKDKYSTDTLSPGDTVQKMKIVQSETYSRLYPLLTRCECQFVTQQELVDVLGGALFTGCTNSLYISTNLSTIEAGYGLLLSASSALTTPKMVMEYAYRENGSWILASPTITTLTKYFEQNGVHYYYASDGLNINPGTVDRMVVGFPYAYFEKTNAVNTDGFRASLNSVYLHIV